MQLVLFNIDLKFIYKQELYLGFIHSVMHIIEATPSVFQLGCTFESYFANISDSISIDSQFLMDKMKPEDALQESILIDCTCKRVFKLNKINLNLNPLKYIYCKFKEQHSTDVEERHNFPFKSELFFLNPEFSYSISVAHVIQTETYKQVSFQRKVNWKIHYGN